MGISVLISGELDQPRRRRRRIGKICHSQTTQCHLRHSPRPRTPMGGDGVANGDCVCVLTLPQLKGNQSTRTRAATIAVRLRSPAVHRPGIPYQRGRSRSLFGIVMFPSRSPGCVSGCVHTLVKPAQGLDRPVGEECIRPVRPSWCSVHVAIVESLMCG